MASLGSSRLTVAASVLVAIVAALLYQAFSCPNLENIKGSVVIITGSSSGIGEELAYQYARRGAHIVLAARRASELEKVAEKARSQGAASVLVMPTNMGKAEEVESLVQRAVDAHSGRLDVLLLNHAAFDDQLFLHHNTSKDLDDTMMFQFQVNVMGAAYATRAALPHLERSAGHIAVVSSGSAKIAAPFHPGYVTTKKALHGFYDTLRHELHLVKSKVTIGILVLGMIATPEVIRDEALKPLAMPVPACASEMICAIQNKWDESYIPKWMAPWTAITYIHPWLSETTMNLFYIFNVPRYVEAVDAMARRLEEHRQEGARGVAAA